MARFTNISTLVCLAAVIIIFTPIPAAPVQDNIAPMRSAASLRNHATVTAWERLRTRSIILPPHTLDDRTLVSYVDAEIAKAATIVGSPYTIDELGAEPDASMPEIQLEFTRAYHSLVFEKLKKLFDRIVTTIERQCRESLWPELDKVALKLREHFDLEWRYRVQRGKSCLYNRRKVYKISQARELELPQCNWERLRGTFTCDDEATRHMIATMREDVVAVGAYRNLDQRLVAHIMSLPAEEREAYVHGTIVNAAITSLPARSPFTMQQLFETPNNAMPGLQMQFSIAYHRLAYEKMETIRYRMETLMGFIPEDAHEIRGILEAGLPEVKGAQQKHNSLERQYWEAYGHKINPLEGDWARRECIYNLQSTAEAQTPTSHDEPISDNPPGFSVGASTSQPRPCLLDAVTHGGGVDNQPPSVGVHDDPMQPGLIDFPDTTMDATSDPSLRFGFRWWK
ncbi:hypothetical protein SeLEV6574_g07237 [Synchytrium endobioticum]|uniref:Uncharacterized protein n=1 Tax=Synchytrium endobioticum TaxID=286115 RepID=A0A507CIK2_9FUNG|nr:hypothetical protein SeLEV6574_g07237 [Synchytrium endobioticum]